jgi:hypothetical protein
MITDGLWKEKKPTNDELIEVFVSRSMWHEKYRKFFPRAMKIPWLFKWLENDQDSPLNLDIFGEEKQLYNFKDLEKAVLAGEKAKSKPKRDRESLGKGNSKKKGKQVAV